MSYEDMRVEMWSQEEYEDFWSNYVKEIKILKCKICGKELRERDISGHMERKHAEKYEEHNQNLETPTKQERPETPLTQVKASQNQHSQE